MANNSNTTTSSSSNDKWYFTKEQLDNTPSRKCGYDSYKELSYRQQTANFIQDMGQKLKVSQLCINTAIVYMHRFYVFHSFTNFPWHQMAAAALFLAAKVEEQPRKLEYVIKVANMCRNSRDTNIDVNSERYIAQSQDLVFNENVLLQTLGFDVAIDHPHTHVVRCCHLVRASKDLAKGSYFLASNSLHLTTMCLQYKPTVVACFCIHLACKWSSWEIPLSTEKKEWFLYVDPTVTAELLEQLTAEFLSIFESCPSRLKEKIMSIGDSGMHNCPTITNSPFDQDPKKVPPSDQKDSSHHRSHDVKTENDPHKHRSSSSSSRPQESSSSQQQREREYRERKEKEKLAAQQGMKALPPTSTKPSSSSSHHHRPPVDPKLKQPHSRPPSHPQPPPQQQPQPQPRDILREATRDSPFGLAANHHKSGDSNSNKDVQLSKRDYLLKPNVAADYGSVYNGDSNSKTVRPSSRSMDNATSKVPMKHEHVRRHEETNNKGGFIRPESGSNSNSGGDLVKRQHNTNIGHDRNSSVYNLNKSMNSTSQKVKSPFTTTIQQQDTSKSVLRSSGQPPTNTNKHHHNGNSNYTQIIKEEPLVKEDMKEPLVMAITKRPSLFSPEKSPEDVKIKQELPSFPSLSPLQSPPNHNRRARNYSSSSEPELRPVMKKIDQVEGFENLMRDSTIGINKLHQVPDIITPINDAVINKQHHHYQQHGDSINFSKEMKPPDIIPPLCSSDNNISTTQPIVNGIETNPVLISSLLKETPTVPHLPVSSTPNSSIATPLKAEIPAPQTGIVNETKEHHHKSKKKNKEKHKHKDKDKNREDKEKKKKHKDKDREKHKHKDKYESSEHIPSEPIKIKIQKDKIQVANNNPIKIKISKDVIKTEMNNKTESDGGNQPVVPAPPMALKIKIPRDVINNCNDVEKSRKRDRGDRSGGGGDGGPPNKMVRASSGGSKESKQNGRHSYNKVTQLGDGDASIHRLAESKYINKNSS